MNCCCISFSLWWCLLYKKDLWWPSLYSHQHKWTNLAYASPFGDFHYTSRTFSALFCICINISELFLHMLLRLVMSTVQAGPLLTYSVFASTKVNCSCISFSLWWCLLYKQDLCWPILYLHQHKWTNLAYRSLFGDAYCTSRTFVDLFCICINISKLFLHIVLFLVMPTAQAGALLTYSAFVST